MTLEQLPSCHGRMFLDPGPGVFGVFAADASGLVFRASEYDTSSFAIAHVVRGSPASEAGVRVGDVLVAVDANPANVHTLESLKTTMQGTGETCLVLRRNDVFYEKCFELRPMI